MITYIAHLIPTKKTIELVGWEHCKIAFLNLKEKLNSIVFPENYEKEAVDLINNISEWVTNVHDNAYIPTECLIGSIYDNDLDREEFLAQLSSNIDTTLYSLQSSPEYKAILSYIEIHKGKIKTVEFFGDTWFESKYFIVITGLEE